MKLVRFTAILLVAIALLAACAPAPAPTAVPPTVAPVPATAVPQPTTAPTTAPTAAPTTAPTTAPTAAPTTAPTTAPTSVPAATSASVSITITLGPGRDGNQPGSATLTALGDKTQVDLNIQPGGAGVSQPVHIHEGACPGVGAVKYPLTNIMDGKSTTVVSATLGSLLTGGFSINAHKSTTEAGVYVACGGIPQGTMITLGPGRDADQTPATAVLLSLGDKTQVVVSMKSGGAGVVQPAHIHDGACPGVAAVKYPLTNIVDGKSVTTVAASLSDLLKGAYAINVHKSTTEAGVYVACGAVK